MYKESKKRSIIKTLSWRLTATLITVSLVFFVTHRIKLAMNIGAAEMILKIIVYYFHERIWNNLKIGKIKTVVDTNKNIEPDLC